MKKWDDKGKRKTKWPRGGIILHKTVEQQRFNGKEEIKTGEQRPLLKVERHESKIIASRAN